MTDYLALARLVEAETARMVWEKDLDLHGTEFSAEALRRVIERSYPVTGLVTQEAADKRCADAERTRDFNRDQAEHARKQYADAVAQGQRNTLEAHRSNAAVYAAMLREKAPDVQTKYRREGVMLAAYWLDGTNNPLTKDRT